MFSGLLLIGLAGCLGDDAPQLPVSFEEQLAKDVELIDQYLANNNIEAEIDSAGLRYVIIEMGDTLPPTSSDSVRVNYEGRLLSNESVFDQGSNVTFPLNRLIVGWQIGLPKIKQGGSITLYVPSVYGYGPAGAGGGAIPPNANLIFEVDLLETIKP